MCVFDFVGEGFDWVVCEVFVDWGEGVWFAHLVEYFVLGFIVFPCEVGFFTVEDHVVCVWEFTSLFYVCVFWVLHG